MEQRVDDASRSAEYDRQVRRSLWLTGFLLGWWIVFKTVVGLADAVGLASFPGALGVGAVLTGLAWGLTHLAITRHAPRVVWIPVAIDSAFFAVLLSLMLFSGDWLLAVVTVLTWAVAPPLAALFEVRRMEKHTVGT